MLAFRTPSSTVAQIVIAQVVVGVGGGMLNVPAQLAVQANVKRHQDVAAATAVFLTLVEIGDAVGAAVSGAVWTRLLPSKLANYLPANSTADASAIFQ